MRITLGMLAKTICIVVKKVEIKSGNFGFGTIFRRACICRCFEELLLALDSNEIEICAIACGKIALCKNHNLFQLVPFQHRDLKVVAAGPSDLQPKPKLGEPLRFGQIFADYMAEVCRLGFLASILL